MSSPSFMLENASIPSAAAQPALESSASRVHRGLAVLTIACAFAGGCGSEVEGTESSGSWTEQTAPEAAGEHCEHGGTAVQTGRDLNADGELRGDEVSHTVYVCDEAERPTQVDVSPEPPSENCPHGGSVIRAGIDLDGNDMLDDAEVTTTRYACFEPEPAMLERTESEPPGEHCAAGGEVTYSGLDSNHDGQLDDDEVTSAQYTCAEPEAPTLTRRESEPAGRSCAAGGEVVHSGRDVNRDGVLADAEIESSAYACGDVVDGHVSIKAPEDVAWLSPIRVIKGNLTIDPASVASIDLPALTSIEGDLWLGGEDTLQSVSLKALERVSGDVWLRSKTLSDVRLPSLEDIGEKLQVLANPALEYLALPSLKRVGAAARFDANRSLTTVELPALKTADGVHFQQNALRIIDLPALVQANSMSVELMPELQRVTAPKLTDVPSYFVLEGNPVLEKIELEMLAEVGMFKFLSNPSQRWLSGMKALTTAKEIYVDNNPELAYANFPALQHVSGAVVFGGEGGHARLERISMPLLETCEWMKFAQNDQLSRLDFPALRVTQSVYVSDNPELPTCEIDLFASQLEQKPYLYVLDTDDDAECVPYM